MADPPCNCATPQYHDPDCLYIIWIAAGKPEFEDKEDDIFEVEFPTDSLYGVYALPIDCVVPGSNIRPPSGKIFEQLREDIRKNGLVHPIVVCSKSDGTFEVKDGNQRLKACRDIGFDDIECFVVPK